MTAPVPLPTAARPSIIATIDRYATTATLSTEDIAALNRRIRLLVSATIAYNVVEAVVAVTAGTIASSTALVGFGLDSVIEVISAAAVAWQFTGRDPQRREKVTLRIIACSFFALAAYIGVESLPALAGGGEATSSPVGIGLAATSVLVMPVLSTAQRRAARRLGSASALADSKQTLLCTYLSAVLLVGLVANTTLGWWWADPTAALAIAVIAIAEGRKAWRGGLCCPPRTGASPAPVQVPTSACADDCCADRQ